MKTFFLRFTAAVLLGLALTIPTFPGTSADLALAASSAQLFQQGWETFHDLRKNEQRAQFRSSWMQVKNTFWELYQRNPDGGYAPKSLYYLGRVYSELGQRSYLRKDFRQATDYYQRVVNRFPNHSWADDAQLRKAQIHLDHLEEKDQAYLDLLAVVHNYPDGDMLPKAKSLLDKMDRRNDNSTAALQENNTPLQKQSKQEKQSQPEKKPETASKDPSAASETKKLQRIRHWSSDEYTRVVLDLNKETDFSKRLLKPDPELDTPHRLVVDLNNTRLGDKSDEAHAIQDGLLRRVRTGQYRDNTARFVLDIENLDKYRVFSLQNPYRVVLDVYAPEKSQKQTPSQLSGYQFDKDNDEYTSSLVEQLGLTIQTVMIDPGHGGKDPGAVHGDIHEKDINLEVALRLGEMLEKKGFTVLYTRTEDKFIPLEERTALANSKKADLFISLHVNAHNNAQVKGFELYSLNLAKSKEAVRVAARENSVSVKKISDLQVILTDLMLNTKIKESKQLAEKLHAKALSHSRQFYSIQDHGVREAPFYVLMGAKMPAVLVEMGYLSNPTERKRLLSSKYQKHIAQGLLQGITAYKQTIDNYAEME
ncbi:MAG: N-acetylmuramoyl-L-alanine amidase [Desulfohalobium sp.]